MVKITLKGKEYEIKPISMFQVFKLREAKEEKKMKDVYYNFYCLLSVIKKHNPDCNMTVEEFEDSIDADKYEEIQKTIMDVSGLTKLFKMGGKKK